MSMNDALVAITGALRLLPDWLYPALVVAVCVFIFVDRRKARARFDAALLPTVSTLSAVEVGLLHSKRNALLAALGELRAAGLLDENGTPRAVSAGSGTPVHQLSSVVYAAICANRSRSSWRMRGCADRELDEMADDLRRRRLLADTIPRWLHLAMTVPLAILGPALYFSQILVLPPARVEDRVEFTMAATIVAILLSFNAFSDPRRTKLGDAVLEQERRRHAGLHPRNSPALATYGVGILAISAALFGPFSLRQLAPGVVAASYVGGIAAGGGDGGGDGSSSSCGGCGGGGGGGGCGCGGGGGGGGGGD